MIASERSCAEDDCSGATVVASEADLPDALSRWGYPDDAAGPWREGSLLVFVGFGESADCSGVITDVVVTAEPAGTVVGLESDTVGDCELTDFRERSYILRIEAAPPVRIESGGREIPLLADP